MKRKVPFKPISGGKKGENKIKSPQKFENIHQQDIYINDALSKTDRLLCYSRKTDETASLECSIITPNLN